jgi:hypothetical protein
MYATMNQRRLPHQLIHLPCFTTLNIYKESQS